MLVSLDVYRPAAQEQLKLLAEKNNLQNSTDHRKTTAD